MTTKPMWDLGDAERDKRTLTPGEPVQHLKRWLSALIEGLHPGDFTWWEAAEICLKQDCFGMNFSLPVRWDHHDGKGGPPVDDPGMLRVSMNVKDYSDPVACWEIPLRDLVDDVIWSSRCTEDPDEKVLVENASSLFKLRDHLRELADHIDAHIAADKAAA